MLLPSDAKGMQKRNLLALTKNKGFQFTDTFFPYTSGEIGPYYVQSGAVMANGGDYIQAVVDMAYMIRRIEGETKISMFGGGYVISGGESRDWMFSMPVASRLNLSHTMIYKDGRLVGADMKGKNVLHVADLNNEGSSIRDKWVPAIKKAGGEINHIFFYVDRMEDGGGVMKDLGLQRHALVPLDEHAWDYLQEQRVVSPEVYKNLRQRMEDKDGWARKMLRSNKGLETLRELLDSSDEKTRDKGRKIMHTYEEDLVDI